MNIQDLKEKNRLEEVVEESGYHLDHKTGARYWTCKTDPSLSVDIKCQYYYWGEESGDVIAWLRARLGWGFGEAMTYLRYRPGLAPADRPRLDLAAAAATAALVDSPSAEALEHESAIAVQARSIDDERVRQARRLGHGIPYPGGIEALAMVQDVWALFGIKKNLPQLFMPVLGAIPDPDCIFCGHEFGFWENQDRVYLVLGVTGELAGEKEFYCADCVSKLKAWYTAIDLLIAYRSGFSEKGLLESIRNPITLFA